MTYVAADDRYSRHPYRRCGRSGIMLPEVSLGLWQNFGDTKPLEDQRAILRRAFDLGVTHFDLANNYGPPYGSAEINFGRIMREDLRPYRDEMIISTKAGYDRQTKEFARAFAAGGLNAVMPNLYHREAPGAAPDDAMAAARASGAIPVPDERIVGEVAGAAAYLRGLSNSNGKVGVIGHCSGGRQSFLAAVSLPLDAAVDCYGGFVVETPPEGHPLHGSPALVERTADLSCPLLGLFGADDQHPSPEHVAELEDALKAHGKTYEFHSYDGAGHAFLQVDRPSYRPEAAVDAWQRIWDFFGRYL